MQYKPKLMALILRALPSFQRASSAITDYGLVLRPTMVLTCNFGGANSLQARSHMTKYVMITSICKEIRPQK